MQLLDWRQPHKLKKIVCTGRRPSADNDIKLRSPEDDRQDDECQPICDSGEEIVDDSCKRRHINDECPNAYGKALHPNDVGTTGLVQKTPLAQYYIGGEEDSATEEVIPGKIKPSRSPKGVRRKKATFKQPEDPGSPKKEHKSEEDHLLKAYESMRLAAAQEIWEEKAEKYGPYSVDPAQRRARRKHHEAWHNQFLKRKLSREGDGTGLAFFVLTIAVVFSVCTCTSAYLGYMQPSDIQLSATTRDAEQIGDGYVQWNGKTAECIGNRFFIATKETKVRRGSLKASVVATMQPGAIAFRIGHCIEEAKLIRSFVALQLIDTHPADDEQLPTVACPREAAPMMTGDCIRGWVTLTAEYVNGPRFFHRMNENPVPPDHTASTIYDPNGFVSDGKERGKTWIVGLPHSETQIDSLFPTIKDALVGTP